MKVRVEFETKNGLALPDTFKIFHDDVLQKIGDQMEVILANDGESLEYSLQEILEMEKARHIQ